MEPIKFHPSSSKILQERQQEKIDNYKAKTIDEIVEKIRVLLLKEMNVPFTVINAISKPTDNVATITVSIAGSSVSVTPQKNVPKRMETKLIVTLVARVNTIIADINL